jgi:hypothetical protein
MPPTITFFPVDNGDMTLVKLDDSDKTAILVDINIREASGDEDNDMCDVAKELRKRLRNDEKKRPYVDVFLLSHPDEDHCSVILQFSIKAGDKADACLYLTGGDSEVFIWEKVWKRIKDKTSCLEYDLMLAPHHCSWHTLSYDRWNGGRDNPLVSREARSALSQARSGAFIVSSSKSIKDDDSDPPCWGAKKEYLSILKGVKGAFFCTGEYPDEKSPEPLEFKISKEGPQPPSKKSASVEGLGVIGGSTSQPRYHG